ncbi:MAG TPA: hypothetical protein VK092_02335, partial [Deinococcales bacterium]|nr:hypothetical protein [Deinococcales bacterium]
MTGAGPVTALPAPRHTSHTLCIAGELPGGDQDIFVWDVDEEQAEQRWVIDLFGTDGMLIRLDLLQLEFLDNEVDVTAREDLLTLETMTSDKVTTPEFMLEPGRYFIGFSQAGGDGDYMAHLRATERVARGTRGYRERAADGDFAVLGSLEEEEDVIQEWELDEEEAGYMWRLKLEGAIGGTRNLELSDGDGVLAEASTDSLGRIDLRGLGLEPGTYRLSLKGEPGVFRLEAARDGYASDGVALKPDDSPEQANVFPVGTEIRGNRTSTGDWYRISIDEEQAGETWELSVDAEDTLTFNLSTEDEKEIMSRRQDSGHIEHLTLAEGTYYLEVRGRSGEDYTLTLEPGDRPEEGWEIEPNDRPASATPLPDGDQVRGVFKERDKDVFSFTVEGETQLYRAQLMSQGKAVVTLRDGNGRETGSARGE